MPESFELSPAECEKLLRLGVVGRVGVVAPDGPHVLPVNYVVADGAVLVRTTPYGVLGTHGRDAVVAFEVDQVDPDGRRGWSVLVRGRAEVVDEPGGAGWIRQAWLPSPWAAGTRTLVLRIAWHEVTGRRLGQGWDLRDLRQAARVDQH